MPNRRAKAPFVSAVLFAACGRLPAAIAYAAPAPPAPIAAPKEPAKPAPSENAFRVPGFLGIQWNSSRETAKSVMASHGFTFDKPHSSDEALTFTGGQILGYPVAVVVLEFCKEGFWNAGVVFPRRTDDKTVAFYQDLQKLLKAKLGEPSKTFEYYETPYHVEDGNEKPALIVGKAHYQTFWQFDGKKDGAFLTINRDLTVTLTYEYIVREAEVKKAEPPVDRNP